MSEYYAVQRSEEYLEHYGVKGMKWGVRKAIQSGNSRALGRQYKKAMKKLAKLEKRGTNGKKYAKRAAAYGAGAAAAGGLALAGTSGVAKGLRAASNIAMNAGARAGFAMAKSKNKNVRKAGLLLQNASGKAGLAAGRAANAVGKWGSQKNIASRISNEVLKRSNGRIKLNAGSNDLLARVGAGAVGAGLGVAAARNAYKAATAKRNRQKAAQFRAEMNKAFAGTQYANGGTNRQGKRRKKRS